MLTMSIWFVAPFVTNMRFDLASKAEISAPPKPEPLTQRPTEMSSAELPSAETFCTGSAAVKRVDIATDVAKIAILWIFRMGEQ